MPTRDALKVCAHLGGADGLLDLLGVEQSLHRRAQVLDDVVDDRVGADLDALAVRDLGGVADRADVEADDHTASEAAASITSDSVMPPTPSRMMFTCDLVLRQAHDLVGERLERAGHVGLEDEVELLLAALGAGEHVLERDLAAALARERLLLHADRRARWPRGVASRSFSTTRKCSPASGTPSKPSTSTGMPGVASLSASPR